jgi:hypothetical protein
MNLLGIIFIAIILLLFIRIQKPIVHRYKKQSRIMQYGLGAIGLIIIAGIVLVSLNDIKQMYSGFDESDRETVTVPTMDYVYPDDSQKPIDQQQVRFLMHCVLAGSTPITVKSTEFQWPDNKGKTIPLPIEKNNMNYDFSLIIEDINYEANNSPSLHWVYNVSFTFKWQRKHGADGMMSTSINPSTGYLRFGQIKVGKTSIFIYKQ